MIVQQWIGVSVIVMLMAMTGAVVGAQERKIAQLSPGVMMSPSVPADAVAQQRERRDFGDYASATLTTKAWNALNRNDHAGVELYADKCIELYEEEAQRQQASLTDFAPKDTAVEYWALNDVATASLIKGLSRVAQGRSLEAEQAFQTIIREYPYAQAWNSKGWMWKVQSGAKDQLALMESPP